MMNEWAFTVLRAIVGRILVIALDRSFLCPLELPTIVRYSVDITQKCIL